MPEYPRRAGVNALGFGGTNFHVVAEEYTQDFLGHLDQVSFQKWPSELLVWKGDSRQALLEAIRPLEKGLSSGVKVSLRDLAFTLSKICEQNVAKTNDAGLSLAVVASSPEDLMQKLNWAGEALSNSDSIVHDPRGIYFSEQPLALEGKVAFLFPGQGSQYVNMLSDMVIQFPEIRAMFEQSNCVLEDRLPRLLSSFIFPPPVFSKEERNSCEQALAQTQIAQPAMGTADLAMFHLLKSLGIKPDMVAGHSYGEYAALYAAGVFDRDDFIALSEARGRFIVEAAGLEPGTMAAVNAGAQAVSEALKDMNEVWIANLNSPEQTIISGTQSAVKESVKRFKNSGLRARLIPVACAFHSPIASGACERLRKAIFDIKLDVPYLEVYSNTTARPYPAEPKAIAEQLVQHLTSRVEFIREIEAMYEDGARIFVEVGPGRVLSGLTDGILSDRPHLAIISNQSGRSGLVQLHHCLGQLAAHGVPMKMDRLYEGRSSRQIDLKALYKGTCEPALSPTTWFVNGAGSKPLKEVSTSGSDQGITPVHIVIPSEETAAFSTESEKEQAPASTPRKSRAVAQPSSFRSESNRQELKYSSAPSLSGNEGAQVVTRFQQMMNCFLETQKSVMLTYLQGASDADRLPAQERSMEESPARASKTSKTEEKPETLPDRSAFEVKGDFSEKELVSRLLKIVSERTGYPQDMLNLDHDLEADLGIDSIKRTEILGSFLQSMDSFGSQQIEKEMESFTEIKTLRGITQWLMDRTRSETNHTGRATGREAEESPILENSEQDSAEVETVQRFTLSAVATPYDGRSEPLSVNGVVVVTDDEKGVARSLVEELKSRGQAVALVQQGSNTEEIEDGCYNAALHLPEGAASLLETIRQRQGHIGGLIHLLPLKTRTSYDDMDFPMWKERLQLEVKSLFYLIKGMENDFKRAQEKGGACIIAATDMGGSFASDPSSANKQFFPGQGGIAGFLKTAAIEWPDVRVKAVDLNAEESVSDLADHILAEMSAEDHLVEVGYDGSQRLSLKPIVASLDREEQSILNIDSSWVILVTGGARGITADVACELARRYQPILILAGRSPLPVDEETPETAGLTGTQELKSALISKMRQDGKPISLPQVEAAYTKLLKEREIRKNLEAMRSLGARVVYFQVDVRNEQAFAGLIDEIYNSYRRIDGVIHGAGVIEDKFIKDKTPESFDRVFDTKVDSGFILSHKLRPDSLKFLVFFASVAGRFGNRGQGDYAAANEVINKLAVYLDKQWPGRVVSMNWGPWDKSGMVSDELREEFARRGVRLIAPKSGSQLMVEEIQKGQKGEVELVIGDGPWGAINEYIG
jgi:acyl transferase domain-containing protein/NADP-dependent 3-hydroxy acid dehydrogenase YdfG